MSRCLRVVFTVQGEGRGHLSQALALKEGIEERGHDVVGILVGTSEKRSVPAYFVERIGIETIRFLSPTNVPGRARTKVSLLRTTAFNTRRLRAYAAAGSTVRGEIERLAPDVVVNFYDPVAAHALRPAIRDGSIPVVAIAHQYLLGHPDAPRPPFRPFELAPFRLLNRLTAPEGVTRLALSFRELADLPERRTLVVPPLLRRAVLDATPEEGDHLLVYVVNDGYGEAIRGWQARNPSVRIHAFWDRPGAPEADEPQPNLVFHRLSDTLFLEYLRTCRGFVGTAGFESVAEAMWLGKPVMVVPTGNQIEQAWNARDAEAAGAGIAMDRFDLSPFLRYLERPRVSPDVYRNWVRAGGRRILDTLEALVGGSRSG